MNTSTQIIFPPQFEPFQPYLSPAYIKGFLKIHGFDSNSFDANIDFYWWFFRERKESYSPCSKREEYLCSNVDDAVRTLKTAPQNLFEYRWAINVVDEYLKIVSPTGVKIKLDSLTIGNKYSSEDLRSYIENHNNIFKIYFQCIQSKILSSQDTQYYFFSLVVLDQLGASLTFAAEIKRQRPYAKIVFGGPMVSRFYTRLVNLPWIHKIVDMIVPGEAYKVLPEILGIQKLLIGHITPDFSDFNLDRYLSSRLVLPYLIAHGCKWGLCTFCSHHLTYSEYKASDMSNVVNDIYNLVKQYNVEYISFSDEYLTARQLSDLVDLLKEKHLNIKYSTFVKAEPEFTDKTFTKKLYESGARLLMYGFESASQRILKLMKKGNNFSFYTPILASCEDANIAVRLDFMIGFPTEKEEETKNTFTFIRDNSELIDTPFSSFAIAVFELREDTPIMNVLKNFGIKVLSPLRGDLDEQYNFEENGGLSPEQKRTWYHRIINYFKNELCAELMTPQNKTHQLYFKDLFDQGYYRNIVTKITVANLKYLYGSWSDGVNVDYTEDGGLIIANYATGGILELSSDLCDFIKLLQRKTTMNSLFSTSKYWNLSEFIKLINFLYRNDYIILWERKNTYNHLGGNFNHEKRSYLERDRKHQKSTC